MLEFISNVRQSNFLGIFASVAFVAIGFLPRRKIATHLSTKPACQTPLPPPR
jgi:hypothetical protein